MIRATRILVPVNGNPTDEEAVALACEVARRGKASVYAIYVIEVKRTMPLDVDLPPEAAKGDGVLARAEHVADEFGVDLETEILQARDVARGTEPGGSGRTRALGGRERPLGRGIRSSSSWAAGAWALALR